MDEESETVPDIDLSGEKLMAAAEADTGLSDWGDLLFREPLQRYLEALEESAGFHRRGRLVFFRTAKRLLSNRLLMQRDLTEHPEILDAPIQRPLFVLGLPRTGTTLLHNLLACDPNARFIRLCEGLFPSPPPSPETWEGDTRIAVTEKMVAGFDKLAPNLATAHALVPTRAEECLWLFEHSFADMIHELRAHVPRYSEWLKEHDDDRIYYEDYRRMVQLLGFRWPGKHWVFKAPRHLLGLAGLLAVFPDARIVWTHRDPVEVMPSLCSLCKFDREIFADHPDTAAIGDHWLGRLSDAVRKAMDLRAADARPERYIDVDYEAMLVNPIGTVHRIYEKHGYECTAEFETAMRRWLDENRQNKHGKHVYSLADYGLREDRVRDGFAEYGKRFCV